MDAKAEETWRKERMYGGQDTVLWAILVGDRVEGMPPFRVVGSFLREDEADIAIRDHNERNALQQQLADLKAERETDKLQWWDAVDSWKARALQAEAERDRYREALAKKSCKWHRYRMNGARDCHIVDGFPMPCEAKELCASLISPSPIAPGEAQG